MPSVFLPDPQTDRDGIVAVYNDFVSQRFISWTEEQIVGFASTTVRDGYNLICVDDTDLGGDRVGGWLVVRVSQEERKVYIELVAPRFVRRANGSVNALASRRRFRRVCLVGGRRIWQWCRERGVTWELRLFADETGPAREFCDEMVSRVPSITTGSNIYGEPTYVGTADDGDAAFDGMAE